MRKLKTRHPRSLPSRLILIVAGALMLIAAFAPRANAQLIAYFNFEGPPTPPYPVNMMSDVPPGAVNTTHSHQLHSRQHVGRSRATFKCCSWRPGPQPCLRWVCSRIQLAITRRNFDIPLFSAQGFFQNMSVSFATNRNGNGFQFRCNFSSALMEEQLLPLVRSRYCANNLTSHNFTRPCRS